MVVRPPRIDRLGAALCLLAGLSFAAQPILVQAAHGLGASVAGVLAWRYALAAALLAAVAGRRLRDVSVRLAAGAFGLGLVVYAGDAALYYASLTRTSAPLASLVHYAHVAVVVGGAVVLGRERLSRRSVIALAATLAGVTLVGGAASDPDAVGIGLACAAALVYGCYVLVSDSVVRRVDPVAFTALLSAGAATSFLSYSTVAGSLGDVGGTGGIGLVALVAVLGTAVAVTAFLAGVRRVGASTASLLVTVEAPATIALAWLVLGERLTMPQLGGAALVVGAIAVLQLPRPPRLRLVRRPAEQPVRAGVDALAEAA